MMRQNGKCFGFGFGPVGGVLLVGVLGMARDFILFVSSPIEVGKLSSGACPGGLEAFDRGTHCCCLVVQAWNFG
jgi:hypothetical protein